MAGLNSETAVGTTKTAKGSRDEADPGTHAGQFGEKVAFFPDGARVKALADLFPTTGLAC
jgi:hypothetical protein